VKLHPDTKAQTDTGYQGIQHIRANTELPKKKSKKQPLSKEDKRNNQHYHFTMAQQERIM